MKKKVIILDDNAIWLSDIVELVDLYFDVNVEQYKDFIQAEKRITKNSNNFDLLITDIYVDESKNKAYSVGENDDYGLSIANFLNLIGDTPIIIVTAEDDKEKLKLILRKYKVLAIHTKIGFKSSDFIISVSKVLPLKNNQRKGSDNEREGDIILT